MTRRYPGLQPWKTADNKSFSASLKSSMLAEFLN
jgi:hypothetical protein